jgi:hypothetical protein
LSRSLRLATEFAVEAAHLAELDGVPPEVKSQHVV